MTSSTQGSDKQQCLNTAEVRDLPSGTSFKGIYVIYALTSKLDRNGHTYWEITVSDRKGSFSAKVWSSAGWFDRSTPELDQRPGIIPEDAISSMKGKSVGVVGSVSEYKGQTQYTFSSIYLLDQEKHSPANFIKSSDIPLQDLVSRFSALVSACRPEISDLLKTVFSGERWRLFRDLPAAVNNHHVFAHGLLEHTVTVAESAKSIALSYSAVYPTLDIDIVVAGALMHDIGKIESYVSTPVPEVTIEGAVLDHIAIGYSLFARIADECSLPSGMKLHLGHILLSHHGQKEFGSPILPATLEALIVSTADELDFRLSCWSEATGVLSGDKQISEFHRAAQRRFWRPPIDHCGDSCADSIADVSIGDVVQIEDGRREDPS